MGLTAPATMLAVATFRHLIMHNASRVRETAGRRSSAEKKGRPCGQRAVTEAEHCKFAMGYTSNIVAGCRMARMQVPFLWWMAWAMACQPEEIRRAEVLMRKCEIRDGGHSCATFAHVTCNAIRALLQHIISSRPEGC